MKKIIFLASLLILNSVIEEANADFTFGAPENMGPTINSSSGEGPGCLSSDGLELYIMSYNRPGGYGDWDIWVAKRNTIDGDWGTPVNLGPEVNTERQDACPCISSDGLSLFFQTDRLAGSSITDLYVTRRETIDGDWGTPVNLGPPVNTSGREHAPWISADGLDLYFSSYNRPGGRGAADIWVSSRETLDDPWGEPVNLGPVVNVTADENFPFVSTGGLSLFFSEDYGGPYRPGGLGDIDIWLTTRASVNDPWETPRNLGPIVNSASVDAGPLVSPDGNMLYFASERPGGFGGIWGDIYQAPIIPVVDLNGDGIVDSADMCIVVDHWGEDFSLCDIGPTPLGDGTVDVQDLIVLAEHLFEEYPPAESVEVTEADHNGQIELERGQILVVKLESNPSTGYRWELADQNESILEQLGEAQFKSVAADEPQIGAGGWEIFRFRAVSEGQMTLLILYHRSWDVEPSKTFLLQVTVNESNRVFN